MHRSRRAQENTCGRNRTALTDLRFQKRITWNVGGDQMFKVVAQKDDGKVVWTAKPFENEKEAYAYADRAAEKGWNVSDRGEVLKMVVEAE